MGQNNAKYCMITEWKKVRRVLPVLFNTNKNQNSVHSHVSLLSPHTVKIIIMFTANSAATL